MSLNATIPKEIAQHCEVVAESYRVSPRIHPADHIFWWLYNDPARTDKVGVAREYLEGGAHTAKALSDLLTTFRPIDAPFTLLDFAAGYGRVTRHFRNELPSARVVACDIHPEAVRFIRELGFPAAQSASVPEQLQIAQQFDVVYALSFFTHMPLATWGRWLGVLSRSLTSTGLLIFTTHGIPAMQRMGVTALNEDGFYFIPFSEQKDLSTDEYGATATSFNFVSKHLRTSGLDLRYFRESGMGYQDLYVATPARPTGELHR